MKRIVSNTTAIVSVLVIGTCIVVTIFCVVGETVEHFTSPTADELYGCTVAQQAPNGECQ